MAFIYETIKLGLTSLRLHLLRSILTALGIIFGVAAVIAMVSIGEGSTLEALKRIESLGARNIIIRSVKPPQENQPNMGNQSFVISFGLSRDDLAAIRHAFPDAAHIVPVKSTGREILRNENIIVSQAFGTTPDLINVARLQMGRGRYLVQDDLDNERQVAVIGAAVATQLFQFEDPVGQVLHIDDQPFTVVGVLKPVGFAGGAGATLIGRDLNHDVHIPITSIDNDIVVRRTAGSFEATEVEVNEIYVEAATSDHVLPDSRRIRRLLEVTHPKMDDVDLVVPFELLEQARKASLTGRAVSATIAGISLLIGGIGIMNIMLATVTERTREIGIRRALGATKKHIVWQFIVETSVLSALGGLIGVALGVSISLLLDWGVPKLPRIGFLRQYIDPDVSLPTHVTGWSIMVAFVIAVLTGLIFGIYPARRAAAQDPIVALRHD
ncbi:MAG: ABC transporter permease [Phycisphaeraceae bacterium]|nr:ABC transporter permease [Phycisphaerales bacterium]MCB9861432.1 ABC transporter permease [Phycisphaeraceae bacterium]